MLKKFGFKNSYSFQDWVELDMSVELAETDRIAAIYGKNASGKSNLIKALFDMVDDILYKTLLAFLRLPHAPFLKIIQDRQFKFCPVDNRSDSLQYHICMVIENTEFTLKYTLAPEGVEYEELIKQDLKPNAQPEVLYKRYNFQECEPVNDSIMAKHIDLMKKSNESRLWFSRIAPDHGELQSFYQWFVNVHGSTQYRRQEVSPDLKLQALANLIATNNTDEMRDFLHRLETFAKCLDSSITGIEVRKVQGSYTFEIYHKTVNDEGISLGLGCESKGTLRLLSEFISIYDSFVGCGVPYICDELDNALHPSAFLQIARMFNDPKINVKNAQLIFTADDTIALDSNIMRHDQVHIVDKNDYSVSTVTRLSEMEHVEKFRGENFGSFPEMFNQCFEP